MIIKDIYTTDEKKALLKAIRKSKGKTTSVAKLSSEAGINPNRGRFIMDILIHDGQVEKIPTKSYNKNYIRYQYKCVAKRNNK